MMRLHEAILGVLAGTLAAGLAGGVVEAAVGRLAPSFVLWIHSPIMLGQAAPALDPVEFGAGLGIVSGLFLGAGASVLLTLALVIRDAYITRAAPATRPPP
jgi:hypothetical protein